MRALGSVLVLVVSTIACGDGASPAIDAALPGAIDAALDGPLADATIDAPIDGPGPIDGDLPDAPTPVDAPIDAPVDAGPWIDPLDHGFGTDGVITMSDGLPSLVATDALGRIVIVGSRPGPTPDVVGASYVERRLATGALDPTFDGDGVADAPLAPTSLVVLTDGRIVVGGGSSASTEFASVFDATGVRVVVPTGNPVAALAAMPDGGFVAAVAQPVFLAQLVYVRRYRADLGLAWSSGQVATVTAAGRVGLAAVDTGGVARVLVTAEGSLTSLAAATGVADGAYAVPGGSWDSSFSGAPVLQVGTQVALIDRTPDAARVRAITVAGAYGAAVQVPSCLALRNYYQSSGAVDGAARLVVAPPGQAQDQTIAIARLASTLDQLDPAWGCGRWFALPPLCPSGEPCLGTSPDDFAVAAAVAIAPGDAPVVVGYQRRLHGARRGFVARLVP